MDSKGKARVNGRIVIRYWNSQILKYHIRDLS